MAAESLGVLLGVGAGVLATVVGQGIDYFVRIRPERMDNAQAHLLSLEADLHALRRDLARSTRQLVLLFTHKMTPPRFGAAPPGTSVEPLESFWESLKPLLSEFDEMAGLCGEAVVKLRRHGKFPAEVEAAVKSLLSLESSHLPIQWSLLDPAGSSDSEPMVATATALERFVEDRIRQPIDTILRHIRAIGNAA